MLYLITGGSGSGKSAYAEKLIEETEEKERYYIATMIPRGKEGRQRVERHQKLREGKGFQTIECRVNLASVKVPGKAVVLLEDLSNLVANELFEPEGAHEDTKEAVLDGIRTLKRRAGKLYIVTDEVSSDGVEYDEQTQQYKKVLGEINQELAGEADQVAEIVYGIPVVIREAPQKVTPPHSRSAAARDANEIASREASLMETPPHNCSAAACDANEIALREASLMETPPHNCSAAACDANEIASRGASLMETPPHNCSAAACDANEIASRGASLEETE